MPILKKPTKQADRHVESVLAALDVLDCFLTTPSLSTKKIIECTGFTRNRTMRLTGTLLHKGYLMANVDRGGYLPGPKVRVLNSVFEQAHGMVLLARPILRELASETGESASLFVREGLERVVLAREEGTQTIRYNMTEGQRMELHTGASGKVLLAYEPDDVLQTLLSSVGLVKRTHSTITEAATLRRELCKIRQQGFAESAGERVADAGAVSAPVFDGAGHLAGALGLAGPLNRFTKDVRGQYVKIIVEASQRLSEKLGWNNPDKRKTEKRCKTKTTFR